MKKLCEEKNSGNEEADLKKDVRSIKPVPKTTNGLVRDRFNMQQAVL